ncbi:MULTISPECIES: cell division protein FtsI [Thermaerobacter]|uniref:Cell division protein FtsI n=1 Tax=Thermaerobacter composti TaxID=554949 RepID=A0ABZ0QTK0_9FIRM|nr:MULTISPECIES: cell division protein FtsI [Thermaerobacter]WPD19820.1 cell division protein FtsI [Thermaerobacter composti]
MSKPRHRDGGQAAERQREEGRPASSPNPAADGGLNPLTTGAADGWGPAWVRPGEGEGVDTPAPYNPLSNSAGFQPFATRAERFGAAPQASRDDPEGAGVVAPAPSTPPAPRPPRRREAGDARRGPSAPR